MKYCYVLTADAGNLVYASAACVSVACLRYFNRDAFVTVLTDHSTSHALQANSHPLIDSANEFLVSKTNETDVATRSRSLKTQLRQIVAGDLLFLDCDAFPVSEILLDLDDNCDFAAAEDIGQHQDVGAIFRDHGWRRDPGVYFNSGVMYIKDSLTTKQAFDKWHPRWMLQMSRDTYGLRPYADQPSLNSVVAEGGLRAITLSYHMNQQGRGHEYSDKSVVVHPFSYEGFPAGGTVFEPLIRDVERGRPPNIAQMIDRLSRTGLEWHEDSWRWQLRERNVGRAVMCLGKKIFSRLSKRRS